MGGIVTTSTVWNVFARSGSVVALPDHVIIQRAAGKGLHPGIQARGREHLPVADRRGRPEQELVRINHGRMTRRLDER